MNNLATVLPIVLAYLKPGERLVIRRCRRAFQSKRARIGTVCIDILDAFHHRAAFDIEHYFSVAGSSVTHLIVREGLVSCFVDSWPQFQSANFTSLTTLTVLARTEDLLDKAWALCESLGHSPTSVDLRVTLIASRPQRLTSGYLRDLRSVSALSFGYGDLVDLRNFIGLRSLSLNCNRHDPGPVLTSVLPWLETLELRGRTSRHEMGFLNLMPALRHLRFDANCNLGALPPRTQATLSSISWQGTCLRDADFSRFSALRSLTIEDTHAYPPGHTDNNNMSECVYSIIQQLETLTTINIGFPTKRLAAPNLVSYDVKFDCLGEMCWPPGKFPTCPRLVRLTLSICHSFSEEWHPGWAEGSYVKGERKFGAEVLKSGLRGWLKDLTELRSLCLEANGEKQVFLEDLPPGLRDLRLSGLRNLFASRGDRDKSQVWPALAARPLGHFFLSARSLVDNIEEALLGARLALRNATVVLREPPGARHE